MNERFRSISVRDGQAGDQQVEHPARKVRGEGGHRLQGRNGLILGTIEGI